MKHTYLFKAKCKECKQVFKSTLVVLGRYRKPLSLYKRDKLFYCQRCMTLEVIQKFKRYQLLKEIRGDGPDDFYREYP